MAASARRSAWRTPRACSTHGRSRRERPPRLADEHVLPEGPLERFEMVADGRLREVQATGRPGDRALVGDRHDQLVVLAPKRDVMIIIHL
jgi:hypothetical protein